MSSFTFTKALCLLALVVIVALGHVGAASATAKAHNKMKRLPGSCLMAASTLCANADTNAMRCLRKLATKGDARVPSACAEAIIAGLTVNSHLDQAPRTKRVSRLLTEATGTCGVTGNSCPNSFNSVAHLRCNDARSQYLLLVLVPRVPSCSRARSLILVVALLGVFLRSSLLSSAQTAAVAAPRAPSSSRHPVALKLPRCGALPPATPMASAAPTYAARLPMAMLHAVSVSVRNCTR